MKPGINFLLRLFLCGIILVFLTSCAFNNLGKEVAILDQTSLLQGSISSASPHKKPLIVLLYQFLNNEKKLVAYSIHHTPETFTFVRMPGQYLIAAFEDTNEDLIYQPTEYASYFDNATVINVKSGEDLSSLDLTLKHPDDVSLTESPDLTTLATKSELDLVKRSAGEIVTLEDPRFSPKNGHLGLWEPIQFLLTIGGGIFFLEPFDPEKIPVLLSQLASSKLCTLVQGFSCYSLCYSVVYGRTETQWAYDCKLDGSFGLGHEICRESFQY